MKLQSTIPAAVMSVAISVAICGAEAKEAATPVDRPAEAEPPSPVVAAPDPVPPSSGPARMALVVRSIQTVLSNMDNRRGADLRVRPVGGRIIVEGTVANQKQRTAVIHAVVAAAPGANLDFMLDLAKR